MNQQIETLADWGEFRLLEEIVFPILSGTSLLLGDDCAYVKMQKNSNSIAITSDATPTPLVWHLGYKSFWTFGWYWTLDKKVNSMSFHKS
jgi:thiamine-monophosphate kinase